MHGYATQERLGCGAEQTVAATEMNHSCTDTRQRLVSDTNPRLLCRRRGAGETRGGAEQTVAATTETSRKMTPPCQERGFRG